jgi:hypothetical protein
MDFFAPEAIEVSQRSVRFGMVCSGFGVKVYDLLGSETYESVCPYSR